MPKSKKQDVPANNEGVREVFARCIHKNGKTIYPKRARFFHFFVKTETVA